MTTGNGSATLRRYRVHDDRGRWLADVVIADDGYFSTVSDYGNYAFWWGGAGDCFRAFLCRINADYLLSKVSREEHDEEASVEKVRRHLLEERRARRMTRERAREEWDLINSEPFEIWARETALDDPWYFRAEDYPPDARNFGDRVLPVLQRVLREELAAERAAAATEQVAP